MLVVGDSLSAAYGIFPQDGWVHQLRRRLKALDDGHRVINTSISGETTAGGLTRIGALLNRHHPTIVIIELGGNDGLRGVPISSIRTNLASMIDLSLAKGDLADLKRVLKEIDGVITLRPACDRQTRNGTRFTARAI